MDATWERFKSFLAQPWKGAQEMSALDWTLLIGMFLVIGVLWRIIFSHIEEGLS